MKKDIEVQPVERVELVIMREYNPDHDANEWYIHLINNKDVDLEVVIMVSKGYDDHRETSTIRRRLDRLTALSSAKMEYVPEELFEMNNQYQVSFFEGGNIHEITFLFEKGTITSDALQKVGYLKNKMCIFAKKVR